MAHSVEEVVETLARLQLVHGMSAVNNAIARYRDNLNDSARALFVVRSLDNDSESTCTSTDIRSTASEDPVHSSAESRRQRTAISAWNSTIPPRTREREQTVAASQLSPTERPGNVYTKMPSVSINPPEKPSQRRNRIDHRSPPPTYTQPRPHPMFSNLDPNMIRVRFPQRPFERTIHCPPGGVVGTNRQRWYIVYVGRKVGIFNEWEEVDASVTGVSKASQNRVDDETSAYYAFEDALVEGRVEIVN